MEHRHRVVTVASLCCRDVNLHRVVEAKHQASTPAVEDQVVEWGKQGGSRTPGACLDPVENREVICVHIPGSHPWAVVFFSSRRRHTRFDCDWSSDVCSSD